MHERLFVLAAAVDRHEGINDHSERVANLAYNLALCAGWTKEDAKHMRLAARFHDIGKIAIDEEILNKPSQLTAEEYAIMQSHVEIGAAMISRDLSPDQQRWVLSHHERPDGAGYPDGLTRYALCEGGALLALADSWDVMTSERPYKAAKDERSAIAEVQMSCNLQFMHVAVRALESMLGVPSQNRRHEPA